ncbi:general substrate transporter [Aspergillus ambiguus]|uniref:general substrate transporter n=1 Tax=Aspergillus ambiguus TaxID=176160 RepID=UPI003CCD1EBC
MFETYIQGRKLQRLARFTCSVGFLIEGYQAGVLGGVQDTRPFLDAIGNPTGTETIPMIASSYTLAAAFMSIVVMFIGMPLGRRWCIIIGNFLIAIGGVIQAASYSVPQMIVGRVLCGFGISFITCNVPMYMSEISLHAGSRGPEVAINCSALLAGVALSYWVSFGFTRMTNQISWRMPIAIQSIFAIWSGTGMLCCPDTPRWYYARRRIDEADATLARLHGVYRGGTTNIRDFPELQAIKSDVMKSFEVETEEENGLTLLSLVWDNTPLRVGRRVRISFMILAIQQMNGINMLVYYMTLIFKEVGLSGFMASLLAAVSLTVQWGGSLVCIPTIERIGRRRIMMFTATVETCCMLIFVILNLIKQKSLATQWTAAMVMFPYLFMYGWGWVGCPWLYGPEIAPLKYRHIGAAAGLLGVWLFTFITVFAGGIALQTVGPIIWVWPLCFNFIGVVFVYFMCPDPTGKTLEEIDALFAKDEMVLDRLAHAPERKKRVDQVEVAA